MGVEGVAGVSEFAIFATMNITALVRRLEPLPMLRAVVPFAAGIALSDAYTLPLWFLAGVFVCSGVGTLLLRSQTAAVALLLTAGFAAAQLRSAEVTTPRDVNTHYAITVEGIPADRGRYTSADGVITAWYDPVQGTWQPSGDRILLRSDSLTPLYAGESLLCRGRIRPLDGGSESFRRLMLRRGFAGTLFISGRTLVERTAGSTNSLHRHASERMQRLRLPHDEGAVVRAMTAGDRSGITSTLRTAYSRSGFSHLLAVSGLHTGIVFALVNFALWWLPLLRRGHLVRNVLAVVLIWLFVAAAGFAPSAVRAAVMCTFLQFALASASAYSALNALGAAAFGMLIWNPAWLGDISFQLSFLAVAGILAWGVPLCRQFRTRRRAVNGVIHALIISLTASAATLPLVSHTFGIVPLAGILLNPIAILLATVVVFGGTLWLIAPLQIAEPLFRCVLEFAAEALNTLTRSVAALPHGSLEYSLSGTTTALIYLAFALVTLLVWSRDTKKSVHLPR